MNKTSKILALSAFIVVAANVHAQSNDREAFRAAMDACVSETGVSKPERGTRPSDEDRAALESCLSSKGFTRPEGRRGDGQGLNSEVKAAMDACFSETGLTKPERGTRPSEEDRATMDACLKSKGVTLPQRGSNRNQSSSSSTAQ